MNFVLILEVGAIRPRIKFICVPIVTSNRLKTLVFYKSYFIRPLISRNLELSRHGKIFRKMLILAWYESEEVTSLIKTLNCSSNGAYHRTNLSAFSSRLLVQWVQPSLYVRSTQTTASVTLRWRSFHGHLARA